MTLIFNITPVNITPVNITPVNTISIQQKNKFKFNSIKRIQMGVKDFGNKKISCGCGK